MPHCVMCPLGSQPGQPGPPSEWCSPQASHQPHNHVSAHSQCGVSEDTPLPDSLSSDGVVCIPPTAKGVGQGLEGGPTEASLLHEFPLRSLTASDPDRQGCHHMLPRLRSPTEEVVGGSVASTGLVQGHLGRCSQQPEVHSVGAHTTSEAEPSNAMATAPDTGDTPTHSSWKPQCHPPPCLPRLQGLLTLFAKSFASFNRSTCALSVPRRCAALQWIHLALQTAVPSHSTPGCSQHSPR